MSSAEPEPILRPSARVILVDELDRVLLLHVDNLAEGNWIGWITPGGGLEPGETHEDAARREILEELGIASIEVGPCVWTREEVFPWQGRVLRSVERFHVAMVDGPNVDLSGMDPIEAPSVIGYRWWPLPEIAASAEVFAPSRLAALLEPILRREFPVEPIDVSG